MHTAETFNEIELISRLKLGDYVAFDTLYQEYAASVAYKINKLVKITEIAEELHQDVFMKVWEQRENLKLDTPFRPFLLHIARNTAIDFFRKAARDQLLEQQLISQATELYDHIGEYINFNETNDVLRAAIAKLPPQRLKIFTSCKLEGKSYEEVATQYGVSLSTVKDHMAKAMRFLRDEMADKDPILLFLLLAEVIFK
ncbi:MAG: RNA polymerase sigma-70 factor [Pedobacter sp.]|uniref:RNA polymerase sigma factor n=1 Tax=Pedobacter sp. TaxID=1411316 RepID=UPI00356A3390